MKKPIKKQKNIISKTFKFDIAAATTLFVIVVVLASAIAQINYSHGHPKSGKFVSGRSDSALDYKNLDLSIAKQANYTGSPVQNVKDLGVFRSVEHRIFRFSVAKDGLTESGLLTLPDSQPPPGGYPVLVLCHGYVNPLYYSTQKSYLGDMEFYSKNGYAVFKPDYRGQGLSLSQASPTGAYYSMGYNTDILSLIADIKQTKNFNHNTINIWGHSMGAYIALRASVLSSDIKSTILLSGPVGNIQDMFSAYVAVSDANNAVAAAVRASQLNAHGTPLSNPAYWNKTSPINYLDSSKSFYQIHVGTADKIVPPQFSADLNTKLTKMSKSHEYFVYPGGNHGLWFQRSQIWSRSLSRLQAS